MLLATLTCFSDAISLKNIFDLSESIIQLSAVIICGSVVLYM